MLSAARRASHCRPGTCRVNQWHCIRSVHDAKGSTTSTGDAKGQQETSKSPSLLEELFPEGTNPSGSPLRQPRHIPRLALPVDLVPGNDQQLDRWWKRYKRQNRTRQGREPISLIEHYVEASREPKPRPNEGSYSLRNYASQWKRPPDSQQEPARLSNGQEVALLILYNASPFLTESDFRRIVPRGKHIREWRSAGEILEIIPFRDPDTLTPLGSYFILFASYSSALAYHNEARRLHWLARKYTPRSLESPIPPPPGYIVDGEDIHAALQSYTLLPPSQDLVLSVVYPPFSPSIQKILGRGGYARLVNRNVHSSHAVSFRVDGLQLPLSVVQKTIVRDGEHNRPVPWRLIKQGAISNLDDSMILTSEEQDHNEGEEEEEEPTEGSGEGQEKHRVQIRRGETRCIIMFEDAGEARRFVRAWHKRPFPLSKNDPWYKQISALVDVELLW